jgi:acyl-CoA thioesterase FadM
MDLLGHMYQGRYHELLDEARAAVFATITGRHGFPFVLVRVELDYQREVRRDDEALEILSEVREIGAKSVRIDHRFLLADGEIAAAGRSVLVAWDRERRSGRAITDQEREMLATAEPEPALMERS